MCGKRNKKRERRDVGYRYLEKKKNRLSPKLTHAAQATGLPFIFFLLIFCFTFLVKILF